MEEEDRHRLTAAFAFALKQHSRHHRKGTEIPYTSHLMQVAGLVQEHGGDTNQVIAALLHDTLEDCDDIDDGMLARLFGDDVSQLVRACSDTLPGESSEAKRPWRERKTHTLEHLAEAPARAVLIAACDKRHNLGALISDLRAEGLATMERFNAGPEDQHWYFSSFIAGSEAHLPERLRLELRALLASFEELVPLKGRRRPPRAR